MPNEIKITEKEPWRIALAQPQGQHQRRLIDHEQASAYRREIARQLD